MMVENLSAAAAAVVPSAAAGQIPTPIAMRIFFSAVVGCTERITNAPAHAKRNLSSLFFNPRFRTRSRSSHALSVAIGHH